MHPKTLLSVLSIAIAASARPSPQTTTPTCDSPQVVACCDGFATNGTGLGCIFSTLNLLDTTCSGASSEACCSGTQTGTVNVQCVPISVAV